MSAYHAAIVRRWFDEVWNGRNEATIDELVPEEAVCFVDDVPMRGPHEFKAKQFAPFLAAFPDLKVEVQSVLADGDEVAVRWTATGTHLGDGLGFMPTGQRADFCGMSWLTIRDGKLHEGWQSSNIVQVFQKLAAASAG